MDGSATIDPSGYIQSRGLKFPKDGTYLTGKVRGLLRRGRYEAEMATAALKAAREGDRVLDLGCGLGCVSGLVSKRREVASIHAFDGNPKLLTYADAMLATNGIKNVVLRAGVLGARKSTAPFYVRVPFAASSLTSDDDARTHEIKTPVHNAKTVMKEVKPNVILCDIEGGEADLLPILPLEGVRHVIIKLHPNHIGPSGITQIFDRLHSARLAYDPKLSTGRVVGFGAA